MTAQATGYDLVIIGGGPAGSAAACTAARGGLRTLVVERGPRPRPGVCAGWLGPAAVRLCEDFGLTAAAVGAAPFTGLRLRSWDFRHAVDVDDGELSGWIVEPEVLGAALLDAAARAGADVLRAAPAEQLQIGESSATVHLAGPRTAAGRVVLIADGAASALAGRAQLTAARELPPSGRCAHAVLATEGAGTGIDVVIGAGRSVRVAAVVRGPHRARIGLLTRDDGVPPAAQLEDLLARAKAADVLPAVPHPPVTTSACLAGAALELESHVGKRCLVIGAAGGFVAAFSNDGLYPALMSGKVAAETVARALRAPVLQDELATFSAAWRAQLADYLRLPNTDLGLLLPMIFSNAQMSRRVARAFLLGQTF